MKCSEESNLLSSINQQTAAEVLEAIVQNEANEAGLLVVDESTSDCTSTFVPFH